MHQIVDQQHLQVDALAARHHEVGEILPQRIAALHPERFLGVYFETSSPGSKLSISTCTHGERRRNDCAPNCAPTNCAPTNCAPTNCAAAAARTERVANIASGKRTSRYAVPPKFQPKRRMCSASMSSRVCATIVVAELRDARLRPLSHRRPIKHENSAAARISAKSTTMRRTTAGWRTRPRRRGRPAASRGAAARSSRSRTASGRGLEGVGEQRAARRLDLAPRVPEAVGGRLRVEARERGAQPLGEDVGPARRPLAPLDERGARRRERRREHREPRPRKNGHGHARAR